MVKPFIIFEHTKIMTSKGDDPLDCSDCKKSIEQCVCVSQCWASDCHRHKFQKFAALTDLCC